MEPNICFTRPSEYKITKLSKLHITGPLCGILFAIRWIPRTQGQLWGSTSMKWSHQDILKTALIVVVIPSLYGPMTFPGYRMIYLKHLSGWRRTVRHTYVHMLGGVFLYIRFRWAQLTPLHMQNGVTENIMVSLVSGDDCFGLKITRLGSALLRTII